jgi:predicted Ser/Thr protein kinase
VRIGPYEVVREIGRGGMGVVYEVRHPDIPRRLAIKVIMDDSAGPEELERFRREARLLARVRHPSVVTVHAIDRLADERDYLVTDFVEGEPLGRVARQRPLEPRRAAEIVRDLALAVEEVHRNGILHRDLKPDNVILRPDGVPVLLDFGLARDASAERLTRTGVVIGTPQYMAPEQAEGARSTLDERTDVYALGATLFFLLAGAPPFDSTTATAQLLYAVLEKEPAWPADAPPDLVAIVKKAMAKARDARYARAADLAADLALFVQGRRPGVAAASRSHAPRIVAGAATVAVLAAAAALALAHRGAGPPPAPPDSPVAPSETRTTVAAQDRPPLDEPEHPLSTYRRQREWVKAHPGDERGEKLAQRLKLRAGKLLSSHKFLLRPKCFWVGATTLLVATEGGEGLFVIDMDARTPRPVPIESFPKKVGLLSGALQRRDRSVRWFVGASDRVYVVEGNPADPGKMTTREVFVVPKEATRVKDFWRVMAIAIDGQTLAVGGDWYEVFVLDLDHPEAPPRLLRPKRGGTVLSLAFASGRLLVGNESIASKARDTDPSLNDPKNTEQSLTVFDSATWTFVREKALQASVSTIAVAPDGRFAYGLSDGTIMVERLDGGEHVDLSCPMNEWAEPYEIRGLAFIAGGERLVGATGDEKEIEGARVFVRSSRAEKEPPTTLEKDLGAMTSLAVSDDGRFVATGAYGGLLIVRALPD